MPKIIANVKEQIIEETKKQIEKYGYENITIRSIAKECGILRDDEAVITGDELSKLSDSELIKIIPKHSCAPFVIYTKMKLRILCNYTKV